MSYIRPDWLPPEQYPFGLRSVGLPSGTVTYVDEGAGPTLLFVHAGMWAFVFRDVIARLRTGFRCITLDFPGYGLSPAAQSELGVRGMTTVLGEFADTLGLVDFTVVAHDLGGPIALSMAAQRANRVRGLVLVNTFAWRPDRPALRAMFRIMGSSPITALDLATNVVPRLTSTRFGVGRHLDAGGRRAFLGPFRDRAVRRRFHGAMRSFHRDPHFAASVETVAKTELNHLPVLTVFGERNDPFGFQDGIAAIFPHHEGIVVEGGNHFPMMDEPELVASSIAAWHARTVEVATPA